MQSRNAIQAVQGWGGAAKRNRGLLLLQNPAQASSHRQLGGHPAPPPSDAKTENIENAECGRNAARQGEGEVEASRRGLQNSASPYAAATLLPSYAAAPILSNFANIIKQI